MVSFLNDGDVLIHPWMMGELALGLRRQRATIVAGLDLPPRAIEASDGEILALIER